MYNEENREKVRHDEEAVRAKEEILEAKAALAQRERRLQVLRKRQADAGLETARAKTPSPTKRFELFPEINEASEIEPTKTQKAISDREKWDRPFLLKMDKKSDAKPWYSQQPKQAGEVKEMVQRAREDPMNTTKARPTVKAARPTAIPSSSSLEEMRKKRLEREQKERDKAKRL